MTQPGCLWPWHPRSCIFRPAIESASDRLDAYSLTSHKARWLLDCWHVGATNPSPREIVQRVMACYSAGIASAGETMCAFRVDLGAAWTLMRLTKFGSMSCRPTATLTASSSNRRPQDEMGSACSYYYYYYNYYYYSGTNFRKVCSLNTYGVAYILLAKLLRCNGCRIIELRHVVFHRAMPFAPQLAI